MILIIIEQSFYQTIDILVRSVSFTWKAYFKPQHGAVYCTMWSQQRAMAGDVFRRRKSRANCHVGAAAPHGRGAATGGSFRMWRGGRLACRDPQELETGDGDQMTETEADCGGVRTL